MMVAEQIAFNLTEFVSTLSPQIIEKIDGFIIILKALGVVVIAYIGYMIAMGVINFRRAKRVKKIEKKVNSIDKKLDILLKVKKKK